MRFTIRQKLTVSYLVLAVTMGAALYFYLTSSLERRMVTEARAELASEAQLALLIAERDIRDLRRDAPDLAAAISGKIRPRASFITADGRVIGDSEIPAVRLGELENHADRPEIRQAAATGKGSAIRYSATVRTDMLYVAYPFTTLHGEKGFLRLALPLSALEQAKQGLHGMIAVSLGVALLLTLILSSLLFGVSLRSLNTISAAAARIGKGQPAGRISVRTRDEFGDLAGVINEMSARIENQLLDLSTEKNRLDTIVRGMGEGLMVTDARGTITLVNPAFRDLFALPEREGKSLLEISRHPDLHQAFQKVVGTRTELVEELTLPLDENRIIRIHWVPLMEGAVLQGVVAVFHDITGLKKLENVRKDFVANVSHELRTPVTVIRGYAETVLDGLLETDPPRAARFVAVIHDEARRLTRIINDLLTISELESGRTESAPVPVEPAETVNQVAAVLGEKAREKGILVTTDLAGLPPVLAARERLHQVMFNLLDNALTYTPENGSVRVFGAVIGDTVAISVSDSGIGIPAADLPRIFERFYRVDAARSREKGGTGLGLAIVKHLMQMLGGTVSVESTPGRGSTFTVTFRKASTEIG